jgi:hypothetical protein
MHVLSGIKMKNYIFRTSALATLFLLSCDFEASIDLSFSHIMRVAQSRSGEGIPTDAIIRFQMASRDGCEEKKGKVIEILSRYYGEPRSARCIEKDFSAFLEAVVPMAVNRKGMERNSRITSVEVEPTEKGVEIKVAIDRGSFERMQEEMQDAFFQKPDIEDLLVVIRFKNDATAESLVSHARFVYVDKKPMPMETRVVLDPGRTIEVKLSDVARDFIYEQGSLSVLRIEETVEGTPFNEIEFSKTEPKESSSLDANPESKNSPDTAPGSRDKEADVEATKDENAKGTEDAGKKDFNALEKEIQKMMNEKTKPRP